MTSETQTPAQELDEKISQLQQWAAAEGTPVAVVKLPATTPSDWNQQRWEVPLTDTFSGQVRTGTLAGEVCLRRSDGRLSMTSVGSMFDTSDDARRLAAALLAAADAYDRGDKTDDRYGR